MSAIPHGGRRFGRPKPRDRGAIVELTPLIDIVFQLLIFFLLTATFQEQASLDVDLARAKSQQRSSEAQKVVVTIATDGRYEIDGVIVEPRELEMRLCAHAQKGNQTLHIRADRESQHAYLVSVMDMGKRCEFNKMGILHQN